MTPRPDTNDKTTLVGLIGNPNTGKTTIFNRLTGMRQRVANYPGITTEAKTGKFKVDDRTLDLLDLPGAYSLSAASPDERVVIDVSETGKLGADITPAEAHRLIFDANSALKEIIGIEEEPMREIIEQARARIRSCGLNPSAAEAILHYEHMDGILTHTVRTNKVTANAARDDSETIDNILMHRLWGSIVFVAVMWVVFQAVYAWAGPLMDGIDALTGMVQDWTTPKLESMPMLQSLVVDGIIGGVGGVLIFLPQIVILFMFIALLEDSGYMARAAFVMDKLLGWCGLNGKSFVPLLSSFACSIPGILGARTLEDPRARTTTMMMAPLMSCSARLPVYVLLIGAFIEPVFGAVVAGWTLFAMHFIGLAVALPISWFANRVIIKSPPMPFLLEIPDYKAPDIRNVGLKMWEGGREFLVRAGTVILAFSVIIWALLYFPRGTEVADTARTEFVAEQVAESGQPAASSRPPSSPVWRPLPSPPSRRRNLQQARPDRTTIPNTPVCSTITR